MMDDILEALRDLEEDHMVPRNIKSKIHVTIQVLEENGEDKIKISRALHQLEEVTEDVNMESYTRMQLLNVVSLLESV